MPVLIVDDQSTLILEKSVLPPKENLEIIRLEEKGYFSGAVNRGLQETKGDVLILNQDIWFENDSWLRIVENYSAMGGIYGDGVMNHPAWPLGYVQGTFMGITRPVIDKVGLLDGVRWPLWGATAEYQTRACRAGFKAYPMVVQGMQHHRGNYQYGYSIHRQIHREPEKKSLFIRTPPLISVIIPCYNYGKYLPDCIASLIGGSTSLGTFPPQSIGAAFEVIIVDDASRDGTREIGKSLDDPWKGIHYHRLERNVGTAKALNFGIKKSFGKYITFLSADDMREPTSLELLYTEAEKNPHRFVYDDVYLFGNGKRGEKWLMPEYDFELLLRKNHVHAGILFPKEAWESAGKYPEQMDDGREDWAFNIALGAKGYCGVHVKNLGYLYRREGQNRSLTNTSPEHNEYFLRKLREIFPDLYRGVRPMACCGRVGNRVAKSNGVDPMSRMGGFAQGGSNMVKVEYLGKKSGTSTLVGPATGQTYRFGGNKRVGWINQEDLGKRGETGFLNMRENGQWSFQEVTGEEAKEEGKTTDTSTETTKTATELEVPEPPEPSDLTADEIKELHLTKDQWGQLIDMEKKGKNRSTVIAFASKQYNELEE